MEPILTIKVEAPEIVNAINNLFGALLKPKKSQEECISGNISVPTSIPVTNQPATQATAITNATAQLSTPPTVARMYTLDELAVAATPLMDQGKQQELVALLDTFGVKALTQLTKEQYGAFATKLRELGAQL